MFRIARVAAGAQKKLDIAKTEMVKIAKVATAAQKELDIASGQDQAAEQSHQRPAAEAGRAGRPWERQQRPPIDGVRLVGRRLGTWTRSRQTPRARRSPQESPQRQCPHLSAPPLTTARAAATSACRPSVAARSGVMSGSGRSTTTAVLHRGHRYAPDALPQPRSRSQWLADVMVDSGMRSPEEAWSGMLAELRTWTWTWKSSALPRRVVYDGRRRDEEA